MTRITVRSPAKVNLFLEVLGRREDGYHEIQTIYQAIELSDVLTFELTDGDLRLDCDEPLLNKDSNLCLRAARLLQQETGCRRGAKIRLEKHIPWGAGLGGGSSNAAATLLALNRLWYMDLQKDALRSLARRLGADVPFFLYGGCALGEGIGERVRPLKGRTDYWLVLVKPPFHIDTGKAYQMLLIPEDRSADGQLADVRSAGSMVVALERGSIAECCALLYNTFEVPVARSCPQIETVKTQLVQAGACGALMSGSGSCSFGIFENHDRAEAAFHHLGRCVEGEVYLTRPIEGITAP